VAFNSPAPTVTGGTGPFTFSIGSGTLPMGLTLNSSTGAITGTPQSAGTFTIQVKDAQGVVAAGTCPFTIIGGPSLTCPAVTGGIVGSAFSSPAMMITGGTGPYTFSVASGTLPSGLTLNTSTGAITGTPKSAGTFTIKVTDAKGAVATTTCPFTIVTAPTANCSAATVYKGVVIQPITLTGSGGAGAPYTFTATNLPPGLTMSTSGTISGTPTTTGTYNYVVTIKDKNGNVGTVNCCSITVSNPTAPSCKVYDSANPPYMTYQDTGVGIVKLTVTTNSNFNVKLSPVPSGTVFSPAVPSQPYPMPTGEVITFPATTELLLVSAQRINTSKSAQLTVMATNAAGLTATCDPVTTDVTSLNWQSGLSGIQTFTNIPQAAHLIEITNGNPGLNDLVIVVNNIPFIEYKMTNGQNLVVDVSKAMKPGNTNTISLLGIGFAKNSNAQVDISQ
jgi:hypothetical protein